MNFGPQDKYPILKVSGITDKAGSELATLLKSLVDGKMLTPDDRLEEHLRKRYGIPVTWENKRADQEEVDPNADPLTDPEMEKDIDPEKAKDPEYQKSLKKKALIKKTDKDMSKLTLSERISAVIMARRGIW